MLQVYGEVPEGLEHCSEYAVVSPSTIIAVRLAPVYLITVPWPVVSFEPIEPMPSMLALLGRTQVVVVWNVAGPNRNFIGTVHR
jgi:hypothetical protein